jgi:hypothetical protein
VRAYIDAFRELDDTVLHLKGLVLVRKLREDSGADEAELATLSVEIDRVRDRLAEFVKSSGRPEYSRV